MTKRAVSQVAPGSSDVALDLQGSVVRALDDLRTAVERSNEQMARLTAALERALRVIESDARSAAAAPMAAAAPSPGAGRKPSVAWVLGPDENIGWAYGNNARRLAERAPPGAAADRGDHLRPRPAPNDDVPP
ncbi:MAG: hypothetical protein ACK4ST_13000, partial [Elioraea tepidiphila]